MTSWLSTKKFIGVPLRRAYQDCCQFHRSPHVKDKPIDVVGFSSFTSAKFLLEVCGAAGAVWGSSEVLTLRNKDNMDWLWRPIAMGIFAVYAVRFYWHCKHYLEREHEFPYVKLHHRRLHRITFFQVFATKLLLEVFGATGAIWGSSEALTWRTEHNVTAWRFSAIAVGFLFFIRWILQILSYCLCFSERFEQTAVFLRPLLCWYELIIVKLILEVLGAVGAVWGFSEIIRLRTEGTVGIWRPVAIVAGCIFGGRWILQVHSFLGEEHVSPATDPIGLNNDNTVGEVQDLELSDLSLTESNDAADQTDIIESSG